MENNNMNDSNKNNNVNNNKDNQDIDIESYQVCSDPCIWVFDDLLSDAILEHVDDNFCPQLTTFPNNNKNQIDTESVGTWGLEDPLLAQEFIDVLIQIGGVIKTIENNNSDGRSVTLAEIRKTKNQSCHMDRVDIGGGVFSPALSNDEATLKFLDMSKQDVLTRKRRNHKVHPTTTAAGAALSTSAIQKMVPTVSFVVYFEDNPGGIVFPYVVAASTVCREEEGITRNKEDDRRGGLRIDGRRGRIIMFQNYRDDHSCLNPRARHFGTFDPSVPKRNFIGGILSNENPWRWGRRVPGFLYNVFDTIHKNYRTVCQQHQQSPSWMVDEIVSQVGGHHSHHHDDVFDDLNEMNSLLSENSIGRDIALEFPREYKDALVRLLTIFSQVDSMREARHLPPIHDDVWWHMLSMMNGRDLDHLVIEEQASDSDDDDDDDDDDDNEGNDNEGNDNERC